MFRWISFIFIIFVLITFIGFLIYVNRNDLKEIYGDNYRKEYPNKLDKFMLIIVIIGSISVFTIRYVDPWLYNAIKSLLLALLGIIFLVKAKEYMKYDKLRKYAIKETILSLFILLLIFKSFIIQVFTRII